MTSLHNSTIDKNQVNHFNNINKEWWSDQNNPLSLMNKVRIPTLIEGLEKSELITLEKTQSNKPLTGLNILDAGCGGGILSEPLADLGANVIGLDVSDELIKVATERLKTNKNIGDNLNYVCDTMENYCKINANNFDAVVTSETIEHVNNMDIFLESCIKCLKPNGLIYVTTINRTIKSWFVAIALYEYVIKLICKGTHEWNKFVTPAELDDVIKKSNCIKVTYGGWYYDIYEKKFNLSDDTSIFYYVCYKKYNF